MSKCICGCGAATKSTFKQGHDARLYSWLRKVERGEGKPTDFMPAALVKALGPWKAKGKGRVPSKTWREVAR